MIPFIHVVVNDRVDDRRRHRQPIDVNVDEMDRDVFGRTWRRIKWQDEIVGVIGQPHDHEDQRDETQHIGRL